MTVGSRLLYVLMQVLRYNLSFNLFNTIPELLSFNSLFNMSCNRSQYKMQTKPTFRCLCFRLSCDRVQDSQHQCHFLQYNDITMHIHLWGSLTRSTFRSTHGIGSTFGFCQCNVGYKGTGHLWQLSKIMCPNIICIKYTSL